MARFVHPHFQRRSNTPRQLSYDIAAGQPRHLFGAVAGGGRQTEIEKYADAQSKRAAE